MEMQSQKHMIEDKYNAKLEKVQNEFELTFPLKPKVE